MPKNWFKNNLFFPYRGGPDTQKILLLLTLTAIPHTMPADLGLSEPPNHKVLAMTQSSRNFIIFQTFCHFRGWVGVSDQIWKIPDFFKFHPSQYPVIG